MKEFASQAMLATALLVLNHAQAESAPNTNVRARPIDSTFAPLALLDSAETPIEIYKRIGKVQMHLHQKSNAVEAKANLGPGIYSQLIMRPIPDSAHYVQLIQQLGVTVHHGSQPALCGAGLIFETCAFRYEAIATKNFF
jgi:hypothetical protein